VTSALPYANGHVHLGHLAGAYLPADIYVRYLRARGVDVAFICGSDEHGVPITVTAEKEGTAPRAVIDRYHAANDRAFRAARVEFDVYHRTSAPEHHEETQEFFRRLHRHGHIVRRETEQLYCERCGRFLPDRYVEGACPHCGAPGARGDQCDACGKVVDALGLGEPRCKICGAAPVVRRTVHWFLRLGDFAERLREWIVERKAWRGTDYETWRSNVRRGALGWIEEGLRDRPITRDLTWGVALPTDVIPKEEAEGKVVYVWFDAPIGYLTFTKIWAERAGRDWRDFWCDPETPIVHFIGKDNIPFHAITWPAMIMGWNEGLDEGERELQLPATVVANEYLNLGAGKFSKSEGRLIGISDFIAKLGREFGDAAGAGTAEAIASDAVRYYLTVNAPETSDTEFTDEGFNARYNELADVLGNFCHRGLSFAKKRFGGRVPEAREIAGADRALLRSIVEARDGIGRDLARFRFRSAVGRLMELAREGNRHFDSRAPWASFKSDRDDCAAAIAASLGTVRALAVLMAPFLPESSKTLSGVFGERPAERSWDGVGAEPAPAGLALGELRMLFPKFAPKGSRLRAGTAVAARQSKTGGDT
jgi:methionyl-tRNA synthetase